MPVARYQIWSWQLASCNCLILFCMQILHITNGDSAAHGMRGGGIQGEILSWRDVLHEGPVPETNSLEELSGIRASWLADQGLGEKSGIERSFRERDDMLRRYSDFDEVVLWFEWDLYDQLQLIQILDFLSVDSEADREETGTRLSIVSYPGYLGSIEPEAFTALYASRAKISDAMLATARDAWKAFRSTDPRSLESVASSTSSTLEFLNGALTRHLEELPSTLNGLSRSEWQILQSVSQGPLAFHEIFRQTGNREDRLFCGDAIMARYIERMSLTETPLIAYTSGERIDAPRTEQDSRAFRNAEMALTEAGRAVLAYEHDWLSLGGSDRWLGGVHLEKGKTSWRWNPDLRKVIQADQR